MKYTAKIIVDSPEASIFYNSLNPERPIRQDRCDVEIKLENQRLIIAFNARDMTALKAALHSYLRWLKVMEEVCEMWRGKR